MSLLIEKGLPLWRRNVLGGAADEHDDVTTIRQPLAVMPQSFFVPEQGKTRVVSQIQSVDVVPTTRFRSQEFPLTQQLSSRELGPRLAAQKIRRIKPDLPVQKAQ
jgi:hypothetical protein